MFKAELAEIKIQFENTYYHVNKIMLPWVNDFSKPDVILSATDREIQYEADLDENKGIHTNSYYEGICFFRKISEILPNYYSCVFHAAVFEVNNVGIALMAESGVGKTTHMLLWQELFGSNLKIINGDKPIVKLKNGVPYAYGTPWCGKENFGCNDNTRLRHICLINRSSKNYTEILGKDKAFNLLFNQVYMPKGTEQLVETMKIINILLNDCEFWQINCNKEIEAAEIASNTILSNKLL